MPAENPIAKRTWWSRNRRTFWGVVLLVAGILVMIYMAAQSSTITPPTALESTLLVAISSGLQIASVAVFNGNGRADPSLARSAVRRLIELTARASKARILAEHAYELSTPADAKRVMGLMSVELSYIEEGIAGGAKDWAEFHPEAIKKLEEKDQ